MTARPHGILRLSNELLIDILDHIEEDPVNLVNFDQRAYLSQESFKLPEFPTPEQGQDLANFRLTCQRFSELGAIHQFARVTTRFSKRGLQRLEWISSHPHLAKHVRKFSYMVPYFYGQGPDRARDHLMRLRGKLDTVDVTNLINKAYDQDRIVNSEYDIRILRRAMSAFSSLQHVQVLRVQDADDAALLSYIRREPHVLDLKWPPACSHTTKTIGKALLESSSPCSRFSCPMLSPQSANDLIPRLPRSLGVLVRRIASLELHFDDGSDLDQKISELSGVFREIFRAAENIQALHVGFPSHSPLTLPLEAVFHHVRWDRLLAFGIQAWKLDSEEIINLVRRHRDRLRGLRLRDVLLKEGNMWKDVLKVLHDEVPRLDWVSLRRIGYAAHYDEQRATSGIDIEDLPGAALASDSDDDLDFPEANSLPPNEVETQSDEERTNTSDDGGDDGEQENDNGPHSHRTGFPHIWLDPIRFCGCDGRVAAPGTVEELGDDGYTVNYSQRKAWEKWCTKRCILHSKKIWR